MAQQRIRRRQRRRGGIGGKVLLAFGAVFAVLGIAAIAVTSWVLDVAADAPPLSSCKPVDQRGNTTIYAADGTRLGRVTSSRTRIPVSIERIPKSLQHATVAIEDQRFYEHDGVDPEGIVRAGFKDLEAGEAVEGGSTITQQLVRNLCLKDPERTLERKIIEAKLAEEYAQRHSRREVLGAYLNVATYGTIEGSTAVGVGAASRIYFSKPVWKLTVGQAALLAGLPQAPSEYNPILHPAAAKARRNQVLRQMAKQGYVDSGAGPRPAGGRPRPRRLRELLRTPRALLLRLRRKRADRHLWADAWSATAASRSTPRSTSTCSGSAWKRFGGPFPTRPTRPRRWSRSTPATATSGRWSPAPTTRRPSSTSPPRGAASPARPSRRSC